MTEKINAIQHNINSHSENVQFSSENKENSNSIFEKIDKDNNGVISAEEAKEYGFNLFEIKENINKDDFQIKLFKTHYDKNAQKGIIYDISQELSDIEKNELADRIKAFEQYKATLDKSKLDELEKNKSENIDYAIKNHKPDPEKTEYKIFLAKYEKFKAGDFSNITNEDLFQLLNYTDTTDIEADGKIGSFLQGRTGDCWFLSMLNNYASSKEGAENLKNRIRQENNKYFVKFNIPDNPKETKEYEITEEDLQNYGLLDGWTSFSSGDKDVRILEIASAKMLTEYMDMTAINKKDAQAIKEEAKEYGWNQETINRYTNFCKLGRIMAGGSATKRALVHKALGYTDNIVNYERGEELSKLFLLDISEDAFGTREEAHKKREEMVRKSANMPIYRTELKLQFKTDENGKKIASVDTNLDNISTTGIYNFSELIKKYNFDELICSTDVFEYSDNPKEQRYLSSGHVYNFEYAQNGEIVVNDPYNSGFAHTISEQDFEKHFIGFTLIPKSK